MKKAALPTCPACGRAAQPAFRFGPACGESLRRNCVGEWALEAFESSSRGDAVQAEKQFKTVLRRVPEPRVALRALGNLHFHQGKLDQAIRTYERASSCDSHYTDALYDLGVAHDYRRNAQASHDCLRTLLRLDPHYKAALYRLGLASFHLGLLDESTELLARCARLAPENLLARYHLAVAYMAKGAADQACAEFKSVTLKTRSNSAAYYQLGLAYREAGRQRLAVKALSRPPKLEPGNQRVQRALQERKRTE